MFVEIIRRAMIFNVITATAHPQASYTGSNPIAVKASFTSELFSFAIPMKAVCELKENETILINAVIELDMNNLSNSITSNTTDASNDPTIVDMSVGMIFPVIPVIV